MNQKTVLLADDEVPARSLLKKYLSHFTFLQIIGECKNGMEAVHVINTLQPDLVFLDVRMPGKSGFEVLRELRVIPHIIFATAYDQYAVEAFNVNAVDYLLKPFTKERVGQAVNKVLQTNTLHNLQNLAESLDPTVYPQHILVEQRNRLVSIAVKEISWLQADGDYTRIHTVNGTYFLSNKGITELQKRLDPQEFQRVHRSAVIAFSAVKEIHREPGGPKVILKNGAEIKVSRTYGGALRNLIY
jgi:two-component system LytT family response regulator